jgi:hypothetical protein
MVMLSKKTRLRFELGGHPVNAPIEWKDIEILATFDNDSVQANVSTDQFTFTRDEAIKIREYIQNGLTGGVGIFEGLDFLIQAYNIDTNYNSFIGWLDLTNEFEDFINDQRVKARVIKRNGLNELDERISGLTYGYLENQGIFGPGDYETLYYVVEKKINAFEILTSAVINYLMIKELAESIKNTSDAINDAVAHLTGGITGPIASVIWSVAKAVITIAYTSFLLLAVIELGNNLISTFISPLREHKVIKVKTLIEKVCSALNYGFETDISDLEDLYYLPSNPRLDNTNSSGFISATRGTPTGIPNSADYGYNVSEMFQLVKDLFNAKYQLIDGVVQFRNVDSSYWTETSTWQMPSVLLPAKKYNTEDLKSTRFLYFQTDLNDEWTIDNFDGTNYEIHIDAISVHNERAKFIRGIEEVDFKVCLGNRKTSLNALETFLSVVAGAIDSIGSLFGNNPHLQDRLVNRVGALKVSQNDYQKPKLIKKSGSQIPAGYRVNFSAKYLYDAYHIGKSFVENNWYGQKIKYQGVRVPFGFVDFLQLIDNSYFLTPEGEQAKATKITWNLAGDYATIDFWVRKPYTKNLQEIIITSSTA